MMMDNVYIYGHHIKPQHFSYSSLDEPLARNLGRLLELIAGKRLGETLTRVPGTKWSWDWVGYGWIPLEKAELARELP